jgi:mRNA interferase MazF
VKRGDVRWYGFNPPDKRRPVLILTRNSAISYLNALTIAPITTIVRDIPSEVYLDPVDGMPTECTINCDNLQTVSKSKIGALITVISPERLSEVQQAINFSLGFDSLLY